MTMPDERMDSVDHARIFLVSLLNRKFTPGVPLYVRKEALARLRHFPHRHDVNEFRRAAGLPEKVFKERENTQELFDGPEVEGYDVKGLHEARKPKKPRKSK